MSPHLKTASIFYPYLILNPKQTQRQAPLVNFLPSMILISVSQATTGGVKSKEKESPSLIIWKIIQKDFTTPNYQCYSPFSLRPTVIMTLLSMKSASQIQKNVRQCHKYLTGFSLLFFAGSIAATPFTRLFCSNQKFA